jgi:Tol biopolymer transport system component
MSKVDDELTRRLQRAERPVDGDGLFEGLVARRSHRERLRPVQAGMVAFAVLAATTGAFVALQRAFDGSERNFGEGPTPALPANGEIVLSRPLPDGSEHLFAVRLGEEGERRITRAGAATYREPSISPDGRTIVVAHSIPSFEGEGIPAVIATIPIEGGAPTWLTDPVGIVQDPEWSPEGTKIAFAGAVPGGGGNGIHVMNADGSGLRLIVGSESFDALSPDWSPDGSRIVFTGWNDGETEPDLYAIALDGSDLTKLTDTPEVDEEAPAWSPDGSLIAFMSRPVGSSEGTIDLVTADGSPAGRVPEIGGGVAVGELDWSPDGRFIAFLSDLAVTDSDTDGDLDVWIIRKDGSDLRNLTTEGASGIAWQPLPQGPDLAPTDDPSPSAAPTSEGRDIGLGFPLCDIERLGGIDWYGDSTSGAAWTGARVTPDGRCPEENTGEYVVAADLDGDGEAEPGGMGFLSSCLFCHPYATTDLDADGVLELVVLEEGSSTPSYSLYEVSVPTSERSPGIYNLFVAPPGHPEARIRPGEPLRILTGGDEGFAGWVGCDGRGGELILQVTWRDHPIEGDIQEVHETDLALRHGIFQVVASRDYELPVGAPVPRASDEPACGVDWQI